MNWSTYNWEQLPADAGQIVSIEYSVDWENNTIYRQATDRSDRSVTVHRARVTGGDYEPQNGTLPQHGEWLPADEATAAEEGRGLHYRSPEWRRLAGCAQWHNLWPVIDADGKLTGLVVADEDGYLNVDDEAMIAEGDLDCRWREEDGYAVTVTAIIEAAVADETIRGAGLDAFAGLEHPAMPEACAAYRQAAVAALEDDPRAGRFSIGSPRDGRLLHSRWAGAKWRHRSGAIGTMFRLTDDEVAALSAADAAGLKAAGAVIEQADAAILDPIEAALRRHGDRFTGGNPRCAAEQWDDDGFDADDVDAWAKIGCWDSGTAAVWRDAGLTPEAVAEAAKKLPGDAISDACGDCGNPEEIIKAAGE